MEKYKPGVEVGEILSRKILDRSIASNDVRIDSCREFFERCQITLEGLIAYFNGMVLIHCGFQHELPHGERPFTAADCPYRQKNIACGHLNYGRWDNFELRVKNTVWFLKFMEVINEKHVKYWLELLDKGVDESMKLDLAMLAGLDIPTNIFAERGEVNLEMIELGVLEKRGSSKRPSQEQIQELAVDIQMNIALKMCFVRKELVDALKIIVDDSGQ